MLIKAYKDLVDFKEYSIEALNMKEVLLGLEFQESIEFVHNILYKPYIFILKTFEGKAIVLNKECFLINLDQFKELFIFPEVKGSDPTGITEAAIISAAIDASVAVGGDSLIAAFVINNAAIIASTIVYAGVSAGLMGIMQLLSPTTSFSTDPAAAQKKSSLFNGAPIITEQGGSVPLWLGESYAGGVLVSSGITTAEG